MDAAGLTGQADLLQPLRSLAERAFDRPIVTLVELLLIGSVVYIILRFLQGTRGARLVRAVLIILAVSFAVVRLVAESAQLDRINELYPFFVFGVFLVSLVAFQTELRRMLLRLGEASWILRWSKAAPSLVDPVVIAVEHLSKRKIGALIAIERNTEMGALIESGVRMDAAVTAELLETIFWPGTPLHDMGVIIQQGRIAAAGCQFPLAEPGEVDRALGSRHRAALGVSQEADAVVIVVSEESGIISIATHGNLRRSFTPETLHEALLEELAPGREQPPVETATDPAPDNKEVSEDGTAQVT